MFACLGTCTRTCVGRRREQRVSVREKGNAVLGYSFLDFFPYFCLLVRMRVRGADRCLQYTCGHHVCLRREGISLAMCIGTSVCVRDCAFYGEDGRTQADSYIRAWRPLWGFSSDCNRSRSRSLIRLSLFICSSTDCQ